MSTRPLRGEERIGGGSLPPGRGSGGTGGGQEGGSPGRRGPGSERPPSCPSPGSNPPPPRGKGRFGRAIGRTGRFGAIGRAALAVAIAALFVLPIALLLLLSFSARWPYPGIFPAEIRLDPWRDLFDPHGGGLASVLGLSLLLSSLVSVVSTALGYLAAKRIAAGIAAHPARSPLALLAYAPYVMSPVVLGVSILYLYLRLGLAGTFLGVVLAQSIFTTSFAVVFFLGFWNEEKRALEDLVRTLGGTTRQLYARVLLPISRGPLLLCAFQTFLISWFQYGLTVLIGGGAVRTLPMKVFDFVNEANLAYAALASLLLVLPPTLLLWANRRLFLRNA